MSDVAQNNSLNTEARHGRSRRALIIADAAAAHLHQQLAAYGYQTSTASIATALRAVTDFAPDIALIELKTGSARGENESIGLARRLRAEPSTYALPLVVLFRADDPALRNAALSIGIDDYFALDTPPNEMAARIESLFWRGESGRRAAFAAGSQRLEIDNFILMLDSIREDIRAGREGSLALLYAVGRDQSKRLDRSVRDRTLADAHGFFKLQLRRVDSIAFYGPTALLVYLPQMKSAMAVESLARLHETFLDARPGSDIAIGVASFPDDGTDIEKLIEKAETTVATAGIVEQRQVEEAAVPEVEVLVAPKAELVTMEPVEEAEAVVEPSPEVVVEEPSSSVGDDEEIEIDLTDEEEIEIDLTAEDEFEFDIIPERGFAPDILTADDLDPDIQEVRVEAPPVLTESESIDIAPVDEQKAETLDEPFIAEPKTQAASTHAGVRPKVKDVLAATVRRAFIEPPPPLPAPPVVEPRPRPVSLFDSLAAASAAEHERAMRASGAIMPRRLVLVISDSSKLTQLNSLVRSAGYEARAAFDGAQALDLLRIEHPDILVLDAEMRGMSGIETLRRIRRAGGNLAQLAVVLLISSADESTRSEADELGVKDVILLPCDPENLLERIRAAANID